MEYKQVIVVRKDLKLSKGKMAAQACHASLGAYKLALKRKPDAVKNWEQEGCKKSVLGVADKEELYRIKESLPAGMPVFVVTDAGLTHLPPGTVTCMGIGPAEEEEIDKYTGYLKLIS